VWSNHQGIVCVYANAPDGIGFQCSYNDPNRVNDNYDVVIPVEQHGHHVATFSLFSRGERRQEVFDAIGNLRTEGGANLDEQPGLFYNTFINPDAADPKYLITGIEQLETGDYMFVERSFYTDTGHGYLIAGWGKIMSCPHALSIIWTFEPPINSQYERLYLDYDSAPDNVVPYVVDFPGSVDAAQTQRPRPRPFYCADYIDPNTGQFQFTDDGFAFFSFPNEITLSDNKIYTSSDWNWQP
jgi:hypothetical protein